MNNLLQLGISIGVELLNETHNGQLFVLFAAGPDLIGFIGLAQYEGAAFVSNSPSLIASGPQGDLLLEIPMHFGPVLPVLDQVLLLVQLLLQLRQLSLVGLLVIVDLALTGHLGEFLEVVAVELYFNLVVAHGRLQLQAGLLQQLMLLALRLHAPLKFGHLRLERTVLISKLGHDGLQLVDLHQRVHRLNGWKLVAFLVTSRLLIKQHIIAGSVLLFGRVTQ